MKNLMLSWLQQYAGTVYLERFMNKRSESVKDFQYFHLIVCMTLTASKFVGSQDCIFNGILNIGMYRISGSGSSWPDIRPFFRIRFQPKRFQEPDISTG